MKIKYGVPRTITEPKVLEIRNHSTIPEWMIRGTCAECLWDLIPDHGMRPDSVIAVEFKEINGIYYFHQRCFDKAVQEGMKEQAEKGGE